MAMCENCKYENVCEMPAFIRNDVKKCRVFEERNPQKPQTNADKIRTMDDAELAEFIDKVSGTCLVDAPGGKSECNTECRVCKIKFGSILDWLQSEAE